MFYSIQENMSPKKFLISFDINALVITISVLVVLLTVIIGLIINFKLINLLPILIICISIFLALYFFPIQFEIENNRIVIKSVFSKRTIDIDSITDITFIKNTVSFTYSSKGVFGYLGKTMDGTISYSTNLKKNILIKTFDKANFIISPKNTQDFINEIHKMK